MAIVNTGHKHWIALRSSARSRTIEVYCPLQSGNRYPRIAMLWASVQARLHAGNPFNNIRYIEGKSKQVDSCNCALLCLQTVQCWMRHAEPDFDAQVGSSTRRARLVAALVLSSKSVHESLGHVVRAEELTETESNIARSIRPLVFTGGNAADEAADIHSDEDEEATGSDDISGPQLDHEGLRRRKQLRLPRRNPTQQPEFRCPRWKPTQQRETCYPRTLSQPRQMKNKACVYNC